MRQRRAVFAEHGYLIRKLNQAYFAFHGAYADEPGAAGEDPVGPAVKRLRDRSPSLLAFLDTIAPMTSFDELKRALGEDEQRSQRGERDVVRESTRAISPEKHRLALVVGGMVLGVIVAFVFSVFYRGPVKSLDLIFWAIGGGLLGFRQPAHSASNPVEISGSLDLKNLVQSRQERQEAKYFLAPPRLGAGYPARSGRARFQYRCQLVTRRSAS